MPQKLNSLIHPLYKIFQTTIPSTSMTHTCPPSSTLNFLGISFIKTLNWKSHISSLAKSASKKLGVLCRLQQYFSPYQLLTLYTGLI